MKEDKALFVSLISSALEKCDYDRYKSVLPLTYSVDYGSDGMVRDEWVYYGKKADEQHRICVTMDSLTAIMTDIAKAVG